MKLGMFDPSENVPYAQIPYEINDQASHHDLAIETSRRSMVLLKNEDKILPLDTNDYKTIAVIGPPNADDRFPLLGNYSGTPSKYVTALEGIQNQVGNSSRIYYAKGCEIFEEKTEELAAVGDRLKEAVSAAKKIRPSHCMCWS